VSYASSGDEGPTGYIEIKKTKNTLGKTKASKKTNGQKHEKKNIEKKNKKT
jgi:hypothetical protein